MKIFPYFIGMLAGSKIHHFSKWQVFKVWIFFCVCLFNNPHSYYRHTRKQWLLLS
jgi:hypothetical protein